ncbi:unnamed protein product [Phyllotreta striolata]|uniref:G-protein coupled receptors family 1 profile domain-containing protein n=1 Tax=Phyllotreta striolata TaxID=444603 RepID=A0A9N9TT84_PHYSR|nr:unnamed protein product [Phyllotreta striolata]
MGSSFLLFEIYLDFPAHLREFPSSMALSQPAGDPGKPSKNTLDVVLYSVITTVISAFGVFTNALSLIVLRRKELNWSVYTYLTVLAAADLAISIMFLLGGLARGTFCSTSLFAYDTSIGLPVAGTINSMAVLATVGVTIDRVFYLWNPSRCGRPKFCDRKVARKSMIVGLIACIAINSPYCFIFERNARGDLIVSEFFRSRNYIYFNWFMLFLLTIIPGVVLISGNFFLLTALQKARRLSAKCCSTGKKLNAKEHTAMTATLVCVITLFVLTEIPANLLSRTRAVTLIFIGGYMDADSELLEATRAVCTLLGALNATVNFLLYYLFCPPFCRALRATFASNRNVQINVIVLSDHYRKILRSLFEKNHRGNASTSVVRATTEPEYLTVSL